MMAWTKVMEMERSQDIWECILDEQWTALGDAMTNGAGKEKKNQGES